ncbi:lasso peptide isopeptide bond-forming cyclase [Parerythrobacter jejuensis]
MFAGIVSGESGPDVREIIAPDALMAVLDPYASANRTGSWHNRLALLSQCVTHNTPDSLHAGAPQICADTGHILLGWIRLDNRRALGNQLGLEVNDTVPDARLVLAAYRAWGKDCAARLEGDFAFAIHDPASGRTYCARDTLGTRPFYYRNDESVFAFTSAPIVFRHLASLPLSPSERWIGRYLLGYSHDLERTAYEEVFRLPPAHYAVHTPDQGLRTQCYFEFQDTAPPVYRREQQRVDDYRAAFDQAVDVRLRSAFPLGAESSGGLDSASIVGRAAASLGEEKCSLSTFGFDGFAKDKEHQQAVAAFNAIPDHTCLPMPRMEDLEVLRTRSASFLAWPPEHPNAQYHAPIYEQCRHAGIRTLLSGFGGDEIVTCEAGELVNELQQAGKPAAFFAELGPSILSRLRSLRQFLRPASASDPLRDYLRGELDKTPLTGEFIEAQDLAGFQDKRLAGRDASSVNQAILQKAFRAYVPGRLESCSLMAAAFGIEYRWPLLDRRLIQVFLATPAIEKRRHGMGRYLHRVAAAPYLPALIQWHGKGMGPATAADDELQARVEQLVPSLLNRKLAGIIDSAKYNRLYGGESQGNNPASTVRRDALHFREQLHNRIQAASNWLDSMD